MAFIQSLGTPGGSSLGFDTVWGGRNDGVTIGLATGLMWGLLQLALQQLVLVELLVIKALALGRVLIVPGCNIGIAVGRGHLM